MGNSDGQWLYLWPWNLRDLTFFSAFNRRDDDIRRIGGTGGVRGQARVGGTGMIGLLIGLLFGAGLQIAGMTNPAKVQNFLDIAGAWDPSLIFVMGAGIPVAAVGYWWTVRRGTTLTGLPFVPLLAGAIDRPLIIGSALFGIGWGIGGFCPGPALSSLTLQPQTAGLFVATMVVTMLVHDRLAKKG